jgi:hypothetical protein
LSPPGGNQAGQINDKEIQAIKQPVLSAVKLAAWFPSLIIKLLFQD